jgi:hypothetical protein
MVQIIEDEYGGSPWGRLGKGIGKGLSEQIPKEIEANRLSKAFQHMEGLTPTQQLTKLASIPGGLDKAAQYIPLLQQGNQRNAFLKGGEGAQPREENPIQSNVQTGAAAPAVLKGNREIPVADKENRGGLASASEITKFKNKALQPPSQDEIDALARKYILGNLTQDVAQAKQLASQELNQNLQSQERKLGAVEKEIGQRMALDLQKGGLGNFEDVAGEIQKDLLDQGKYLVSGKGLTPEAAAQQISKVLRDLGKTANQTKTTGALSNLFTSSEEKTKNLKTQRKEFEKYGYGELFDDMAASAMGITQLQAASVLDPLKNEAIEKSLSKFKDHKIFSFEKEPIKLKEKDLDRIARDLKPSDNLFSIAEKMRGKDIDVNDFMTRISDLADEGKIALTDQQRRQTQKPVNNSFLGDILYKIF